MTRNLTFHHSIIKRPDREKINGHRSIVLWFTGLSGAGKSTLAHAVEARLHKMNCRTYVFDGDNVRHGLCSDLGFSPRDRGENIRRIGEMTKLFVDAGIIALTAFISPFRKDRAWVRSLVGPENFTEIYCDCSLETCEKRDVKGIYARARRGDIPDFTGISSPYEPPENPDLHLKTGETSLPECVEEVIRFLRGRSPEFFSDSKKDFGAGGVRQKNRAF
ncbi:MAG: adenylyl-sulfate kinase [Nitrospiraceae bacterium]|nr:adenylyl-sulfate kinase [Nitrospiraceae bacterium]